MDKKILILEDEIDVAQLYAKYLRVNGYDPVIAYNGLEGLEQLKHVNPDLILLDLGMPIMNGIEFYQRICDAENNPRYPILVLTGRSDLETMFKDLHVDGFLLKPFREDKLLNEVDIILNHQYWRKADGSARRVVIVDDNQSSAKKIARVLSHAGYVSEIAGSGVAGVENIMASPPDLAVVSLGLEDLTGDLVILRLLQSIKTRYTNFILYIRKNFKHDEAIMEHFSHKRGVRVMCEYERPTEILVATITLFQEEGRGV